MVFLLVLCLKTSQLIQGEKRSNHNNEFFDRILSIFISIVNLTSKGLCCK